MSKDTAERKDTKASNDDISFMNNDLFASIDTQTAIQKLQEK